MIVLNVERAMLAPFITVARHFFFLCLFCFVVFFGCINNNNSSNNNNNNNYNNYNYNNYNYDYCSDEKIQFYDVISASITSQTFSSSFAVHAFAPSTLTAHLNQRHSKQQPQQQQQQQQRRRQQRRRPLDLEPQKLRTTSAILVPSMLNSDTTTTAASALTDHDEEVLFGGGGGGGSGGGSGGDGDGDGRNNNENYKNMAMISTSISEGANAPSKEWQQQAQLFDSTDSNGSTTPRNEYIENNEVDDEESVLTKLRTMRNTVKKCPELWTELASIFPSTPSRALFDEHLCDTRIDWTYEQLYEYVQASKRIFQQYFDNAVEKRKRNKMLNGWTNNNNDDDSKNLQEIVPVFGENSAYWLLVDQGIQSAGGITAVRGADAPIPELQYIYNHCDSTVNVVVLQDVALLQKLYRESSTCTTNGTTLSPPPLGLTSDLYGDVETIILMHRGRTHKNNEDVDRTVQSIAKELNVNIRFFGDLLEQEMKKQTTAINDSIVNHNMDRSDSSNENSNNNDKNDKNDGNDDAIATLVYTSGTTGNPKGVMLTHKNLLHQLSHRLAPTQPYKQSEPMPGDTMIALLPVWHITERTFELWMLSRGCNVVYSSIRTFKKDLALHKPQWLVLVPRVLEKIATGVQEKFASSSAAVRSLVRFFTAVGKAYNSNLKVTKGLIVVDNVDESNKKGQLDLLRARAIVKTLSPINAIGQKLVWAKVQDGFGGRLKLIISGGSALAGGLETFYETAGIPLCVGYGLTECSPLLSHRRSDSNLVTAGCAGKECYDTSISVVDPEEPVNANQPRRSLPHGQVGLILGKGPQVMKGYYKNPEATAKAIDKFGWFDTGDLGRINPATGDLILTGRVKDTIVLSNGENVEPVPIEDAILGDIPMVEQVMVTTAGTAADGTGDGKGLVAIVVLNPTELFSRGFISDQAQVKKLTEAMEIVNTPQCTNEEYEKLYHEILLPATELLRCDIDVCNFLQNSVRASQKSRKTFRKWEDVKDFLITLVPFAMVNGQLTQSYKVKRPAVMERYNHELLSMKSLSSSEG